MLPFRYALTPAERETYLRFSRLALPRHTSYPIAPVWTTAFGADEYRSTLQQVRDENRDLSIYVHVPFCERLCYYCACTKEIVPAGKHADADPSIAFLDTLEREIEQVSNIVGKNAVRQLHFGGGTPTFLEPKLLGRLAAILRSAFSISPDAELAVEIDPRVTTRDHLTVLRKAGFNRISIGVQDFDETVQRTVNRIQPFEMVQRFVAECRSLGFTSVNFDLIYGLPNQTLRSMAETLDQVIALSPDRIAFYRLAVIPDIFRWQNTFRHADLPSGDACLELNLLGINTLLAAGYEFIGLDHFARPGESLAAAAREGSVRRNFQGMTTGKALDVVGLGPSAISQLRDAFAQNARTSSAWKQALTEGFATECGWQLSTDDRIRKELMQQLYGYGTIDKRALESEFGINFDDYFTDTMPRLRHLELEGIVTTDENFVRVTTPLGRLLVRVVAAAFDRYLPADAYFRGMQAEAFSRVG